MLVEHIGGALHFGRIEPAEAFVGKQQPRLGGERAGKFELLERGGAEPVGPRRGFGRQADQVERFLRAALRFRPADTAGLAVIGGERHILEQRELAEGARNLKGARDPVMADRVRRQPGDFLALEADRARTSGAGCPRSG